jgi:hypothetical protein
VRQAQNGQQAYGPQAQFGQVGVNNYRGLQLTPRRPSPPLQRRPVYHARDNLNDFNEDWEMSSSHQYNLPDQQPTQFRQNGMPPFYRGYEAPKAPHEDRNRRANPQSHRYGITCRSIWLKCLLSSTYVKFIE